MSSGPFSPPPRSTSACLGFFRRSRRHDVQYIWKALGLSGTQLTDAAAEAFSRALMEGKFGGGEGHEDGAAGGGQNPNQEKTEMEAGAGGGGRDSFPGEEEGEERRGGEGARAGARANAACSLRRLDLSRNSITDNGARYVRCFVGGFFIARYRSLLP